MPAFASFADLRAVCLDLPSGHPAASLAVAMREDTLTKPPKSLGRLEELAAFLAHWQGHAPPRLDRTEVLVFAGNHGVTRQGVSAYPAEVTAQMVANFSHGGAAINQFAGAAGAALRVIPLQLDAPTADFTESPALTEAEFLAAVAAGHDAVSPDSDLICLGEMGIGNTTAAAALAAASFGGGGARWAGRGTGVDDDGLAESATSSTARSIVTQACSTIRSASPRPSAAASLPPFSAPCLPPAATPFRCCSTASSAPPPWRRSTGCAPIRLPMQLPGTSRRKPATACCSMN